MSLGTKDIKKILDSMGILVDNNWINKVISELSGKNMITQGNGKLASVPTGGAVVVSAASGAAAPAAGSAPAAEDKDEKKESWESDNMGFGLFD